MSATSEVIGPVRLGHISTRGFMPLRVETTKIAYKEHFVAPAGRLCSKDRDVLLIFEDDRGIVPDWDGLFFVSTHALFTVQVLGDTLFLFPAKEKYPVGWVIVWDVDFGFGESAVWTHSESVRTLIKAQKNCSEALEAPALPILFVPHGFPAALRWGRKGRHGTHAEWVAMWLPWVGVWHVSPLPEYK